MSRSSRPRVLAIGIDAAEPTLVRRLIAEGRLPALRALLDRGAWGEVRSPAPIGSGAVWPTFMTGEDPHVHGVYSVLPWDARAMRLVRLTTDGLTPFWQGLAQHGHAVGVVDVPFAPVTGLAGGIEISEWGAHDRVRGRVQVSPPGLQEWLTGIVPGHPFGRQQVEIPGPRSWKALHNLTSLCLEGTRLRGDLATRLLTELRLDVLLVVFTEVHHASHYLWHTLEPALAGGIPPAQAEPRRIGSPSLRDVYRQVDFEIGRLEQIVGEDALVLVFSLHGMRSTRGIPAILDPLLRALGMAAARPWRAQTWYERRRRVAAVARELLPGPLLRLYRRTTRPAHRRPQLEIPLPYDWSRTTAFPVPTDQHGWIRVNLQGREAAGTVPPERYAEVCARLEQTLRALRTNEAHRVVADVLWTARDTAGPPEDLPDLIVHWDDHALADPLRLTSPRIAARPTGRAFTGQHAPAGFFLLRPARDRALNAGASLAAEELHLLIRTALQPQ